MKKPVSKFAFQMQPAALHLGVDRSDVSPAAARELHHGGVAADVCVRALHVLRALHAPVAEQHLVRRHLAAVHRVLRLHHGVLVLAGAHQGADSPPQHGRALYKFTLHLYTYFTSFYLYKYVTPAQIWFKHL